MDKAISAEKYRRLNQLLKKQRIALGLSMRELGEILGEPHSLVQKVEASQRKLDVFQYVQYCEALNLDPAEIISILAADRRKQPKLTSTFE